MRILYAHRTRGADGSAVHMRGLQDAFRARGHEVLEVAPRTGVAGAARADAPERKGRARGALREAAEYAYTPLGAALLARAIRAFRPDFVYQRYAFADGSGVLAARRFRVPIVLEVNAPLARELRETRGLLLAGFASRVERRILRRASKVAVVSFALRDELAASTGLERNAFLVTPNGVDLRRFRPGADPSAVRARWGLPAGRVVGFVGWVRDWHRLDLALEAIADPALAALGAHFLLVGDGPARRSLEARARALGLGSRARFTGPLAHEAIPEHLAACDVALLPAVNGYASPLKLFEYLASGNAVLAPRQSNVEEIVRDGEEALLFEPGDRAALRDGLVRLLTDGALRDALGRAGRRRILAGGFTWEENARRVEEAVAPLLLARAPEPAPREERG